MVENCSKKRLFVYLMIELCLNKYYKDTSALPINVTNTFFVSEEVQAHKT